MRSATDSGGGGCWGSSWRWWPGASGWAGVCGSIRAAGIDVEAVRAAPSGRRGSRWKRCERLHQRSGLPRGSGAIGSIWPVAGHGRAVRSARRASWWDTIGRDAMRLAGQTASLDPEPGTMRSASTSAAPLLGGVLAEDAPLSPYDLGKRCAAVRRAGLLDEPAAMLRGCRCQMRRRPLLPAACGPFSAILYQIIEMGVGERLVMD